MIELRRLLRNAGVSLVEAERQLAGHFPGEIWPAKATLCCPNPMATWQSSISNGQATRTGIALQTTATSSWPSTQNCYVRAPVVGHRLPISSSAQATLISRDDGCFPGVTPVADKTGENAAQLWLRFLEDLEMASATICRGSFREVVLKESDEPDSMPPDNGLTIEALNTSSDDCWPAGWGDQA